MLQNNVPRETSGKVENLCGKVWISVGKVWENRSKTSANLFHARTYSGLN
jgi:hypothetical protein